MNESENLRTSAWKFRDNSAPSRMWSRAAASVPCAVGQFGDGRTSYRKGSVGRRSGSFGVVTPKGSGSSERPPPRERTRASIAIRARVSGRCLSGREIVDRGRPIWRVPHGALWSRWWLATRPVPVQGSDRGGHPGLENESR